MIILMLYKKYTEILSTALIWKLLSSKYVPQCGPLTDCDMVLITHLVWIKGLLATG